MDSEARYAITPRKGPDFGLDGDIPRHWFGGDAFRTRFFDAMSLLFPEGERFFIACVRDYRDRIGDPALAQEVRDFIYQEGQHGQVHTRFNDRLRAQGVAVDRILQRQKDIMFGFFRKRMSSGYTLAQTAAAEHMTALMAHGFFGSTMFADADPRIRAMYAWHAIEEIEHKAVAFDVMQKVAGVGYFQRVLAMLQVSLSFPLHVFLIMAHMFRIDGFGLRQRAGLWLRGLWWLYGPRGVFPRLLGAYLVYFLPRFHPWRHGDLRTYHDWLGAFERHGQDAVAASDELMARNLATA